MDFSSIELYFSSLDLAKMALMSLQVAGIIIITKIVIAFLRPLSEKIDRGVDKFWKLDLPEYAHAVIESFLVLTVIIIALYAAFIVGGVASPIDFLLFNLLAFLFFCKTLLDLIKPAALGLDKMLSLGGKSSSMHIRSLFKQVATYTVYSIALIGIIYILGFTDIFTAAIAGAGVLGLAVGFASKDTASNAIAGITLIMDKPFKIGEFVEVGGLSGTVEEIRLRSTRMVSSENLKIILPNSFLMNKPIKNYSRIKWRKINFSLTLAPSSNIEHAVKIIKKEIGGVTAFQQKKKVLKC
ncbi:mechanosensitive ion channel family protein [archaeon]|nr:mechanosensitive ion channel family protein [archaeon]